MLLPLLPPPSPPLSTSIARDCYGLALGNLRFNAAVEYLPTKFTALIKHRK